MRLFEKIVLLLVFILLVPFVYAKNCDDLYGGLDYFKSGCIVFYDSEYCDRCVDSNVLIEVYCKENNLVLEKYDCPNGCIDGECISTTTTTTSTTTITTTSVELTTTVIEHGSGGGIITTTTTTTVLLAPPTSTTTTIQSAVEPCSREGDFCPTGVNDPDDVTGYCVKKEYYNSHNNWFKGLTDSCGNDYCCVACAKNDCCWKLRGYCYSFNNESSTGCLADGDVSVNGYSHKCGEMLGDNCTDDTTGYFLIDSSGEPPYGPYKCVASMSQNILTTTKTETTRTNSFTTTTSINVMTTTSISGFTNPTTTIKSSVCTGTNIYACYETDQERCELKACCYWSNGKCGRLPCDQLSESECSKCTGCQSESEGSKTITTTSEPHLKSTTTIESGFLKRYWGKYQPLNLISTIAIVVVITLVVLAIIFGVMKLTRSKSSEPKQQYDEENSERSFY
jgi:hypothetical protein